MRGALGSSQPLARHPNDHLQEEAHGSPVELAAERAPEAPLADSTPQRAQQQPPPSQSAESEESNLPIAPIIAQNHIAGSDRRGSQDAQQQGPQSSRAPLEVGGAAADVEGEAGVKSRVPSGSPESLESHKPIPNSTSDAVTATKSNERGLRPTGHFFPSVLRHDTSMSAGELHVPGEWTSARES